MRAEVVAHVKSAVRFVGMADFQYVSHDSRPLHEQAPQAEGPPGLDAEPMLIPPTHFTRVDMPLDYAFRSYYSGDPDYMKTGGLQNIKLLPRLLATACCITDADVLRQGAKSMSALDFHSAGARVGRSIGRLATHVINFQAVNVLPPLSDPGAGRTFLDGTAMHFCLHPQWWSLLSTANAHEAIWQKEFSGLFPHWIGCLVMH